MPHKFGINSPQSVKHISWKAFFKHAQVFSFRSAFHSVLFCFHSVFLLRSALLSAYRLHPADLLTLSTVNTLWMICFIYRINLHLAGPAACPAADTFFLIHPVPKYGDRIKYGINRSQRTYVLAERPINND